jgi:hypothetical protein
MDTNSNHTNIIELGVILQLKVSVDVGLLGLERRVGVLEYCTIFIQP